MKLFHAICICSACLVFSGMAYGLTATWDVATVHGTEQFTISPVGTSLHYNQQGWTDYVWYQNNGSAPGTIAQGMYGDRTGMRTFAITDVAFGQRLDSVKLAFDYKTALGYTTINYFLTDGEHFGIFAPTSLGIAGVSTSEVIDSVWTRITLDLTAAIPDVTNVAVYEDSGFDGMNIEPFTTLQWGDIKGLTIAGMYDFTRSPTGGWDAWGTSFDANHGIALIWGDTVNSNNSYGSTEKEIRNVVVSFGGNDYTGTFRDATVPEPVTMLGLLLSVGGVGAYIRRRRMA